MTASECVINQYHKRYNYFERITPDGKSVFISKKTGEEFSRQELDAIHPTPNKLWRIDNCNKTNFWMDDIKSF